MGYVEKTRKRLSWNLSQLPPIKQRGDTFTNLAACWFLVGFVYFYFNIPIFQFSSPILGFPCFLQKFFYLIRLLGILVLLILFTPRSLRILLSHLVFSEKKPFFFRGEKIEGGGRRSHWYFWDFWCSFLGGFDLRELKFLW